MQAVEVVHTVGTEPPIPHIQVRMKLDRNPRRYKEQVLKKIRQFPLQHPMGCAPRPPAWDTTEATAGLTGPPKLTALHALLVNGMEYELCGLHGIEEAEKASSTQRQLHPPKERNS